MNGDHLQQGISGRQPPPHHSLSREQRVRARQAARSPAVSPAFLAPLSVTSSTFLPKQGLQLQSKFTQLDQPNSSPLLMEDSDQSHLQQGFALLVLIFAVKLDVEFLNQFGCLLFLEGHDRIEHL